MKKVILVTVSLIALFFLFGKSRSEIENVDTSPFPQIVQKNIEKKDEQKSDVETAGVKPVFIADQQNVRAEKESVTQAQAISEQENRELTDSKGYFSISNTIKEIEEKNKLNPDVEFNSLKEPKPDIWTRSITFSFRDDKNDIELNLIWDKENNALAPSSCFYSEATGIKMYKNGNLHLKVGEFGYAALFLNPDNYVRFKPSHTHDFDNPGKIFTRTATGWKETKKFMAQELLVDTKLRLKHCFRDDADR